MTLKCCLQDDHHLGWGRPKVRPPAAQNKRQAGGSLSLFILTQRAGRLLPANQVQRMSIGGGAPMESARTNEPLALVSGDARGRERAAKKQGPAGGGDCALIWLIWLCPPLLHWVAGTREPVQGINQPTSRVAVAIQLLL